MTISGTTTETSFNVPKAGYNVYIKNAYGCNIIISFNSQNRLVRNVTEPIPPKRP